MLGLRSPRGGRPLVSEYDDRQFVGIDLHRRRTVIVRQSESGEQLGSTRIVNDPAALAREIGKAGAEPEAVVGAAYNWCPRDSTARTDSQRANTTHRYRPHSKTPSEPACVNRAVGIVTGTERACDRPCGRRAPASARRPRPA